jgi:hypothetical protein
MKENTMSHATDQELSGRHPVNIGHLVMGLAFVGMVGVWALIQADVVQGDGIRWLLPLPWVVAGIAGLLATTLSSRGRRGGRASEHSESRWAARQTGWVGTEPGYDAGPEAYGGYTYDPSDWTTDNPYSSTDRDTTEETR